jgi:hypothetical protein
VKIFQGLLLVLFLVIGIAIGIWFGVDRIIVDVNSGSPINTFELLGILSSIVACVATIVAALLAIWVCYQWYEQQTLSQSISYRTRLAKEISTLRANLNKLMYSKRECNTVINKKRLNLLLSISEVNTDIDVYYALKGKVFTFQKVGDELDPVLDLIEIASQIHQYFDDQLKKDLAFTNSGTKSETEFERIFKSVIGTPNQDPVLLNAVAKLGSDAIKSLIGFQIK